MEKREPIHLSPSRRWRLQVFLPATVLVVVLAAVAGWYVVRPHPPTPVRVRRLTSLPGNESFASLSPDGNFVVFAWNSGGPADLYTKAVDSESISRITETPESELSPAWSPDGREIAFVRGGKGVFIIAGASAIQCCYAAIERREWSTSTNKAESKNTKVTLRSVCMASS
jgi:WD40-like Beta Propeller Repeat